MQIEHSRRSIFRSFNNKGSNFRQVLRHKKVLAAMCLSPPNWSSRLGSTNSPNNSVESNYAETRSMGFLGEDEWGVLGQPRLTERERQYMKSSHKCKSAKPGAHIGDH